MVDATVLPASERTVVGKSGARAARRNGQVPAIVYGAKDDPTPIAIDPKILNAELNKPGFFSQLFDIDVGGKNQRVLCRDVQYHPVTSVPLHADFLRVSAATRINVEVQVNFINEEESPGLKVGGVLNIVRHAVELNCRADAIPSELIADLTGKEIGDSIHISSIDLPDGVEPTITDRDFTIATIAAPTIMAAEDEETDEEGEGEEGLLEGEEAAEGEAPEAAEPEGD